MNEKVVVDIFKRRIPVEIEGLTPLEIITLARTVSEKMEEVARNNEKVADSSKLAILAALELAADLARVKDAHHTAARMAENKIEELILLLQTQLGSSGK